MYPNTCSLLELIKTNNYFIIFIQISNKIGLIIKHSWFNIFEILDPILINLSKISLNE